MKLLITTALAAVLAIPAYAQEQQSASAGSSSPQAADTQPPVQETWYYPDGTMAYRQGDGVVVVQPDGQVSSPQPQSDPTAPARANGDDMG